ncbi:MAG: ABC transporter permease [Anaerolineae bacterium]|nr:ABC transporter permease [Anaerolineae bacterium]
MVARFFLPLVFIFLTLLGALTSAQFLMTGVVEEKENRISELLLTSSSARELMTGKVLGLGSLALTQLVYMVTLGLVLAAATENLALLGDLRLGLLDLLVFGLFFLLNFFLISGLMLIIGAAVAAEQESRQIAGLVVLVTLIPLYAIIFQLENLEGNPLLLFLSLFPLTAAPTVLMLSGFQVMAAWQLPASLAVLLLSTIVMLWAGARVFRRGILMYDQRLSLRQLRQIIQGRA